jgi:hypothetical protein
VPFNLIERKVTSVPTGLAADKRLDDLMASQQQQVATSGKPKS